MRTSIPLSVFLSLFLAGCVDITQPVSPERETFSRSDDYDYQLSGLSGASTHIITLTETGFVWPATNPGADTALLEISVHSSRGNYPAIEVRAGGINTVQYFERGGKGLRYLDLSPFLNGSIEPGAYIELNGSGAKWNFEITALLTFTNPAMTGRRVLVVAPHPDDAEIAAYGVYKSSHADVVTITAGDAGGANFAALWPIAEEQYRAKGRIRTIDSLTVPLLAGLKTEAVRNLGYYDGTLRRLWTERPRWVAPRRAKLKDHGYFRRFNFDAELRDRKFVSSWQALVADLVRELEKVQPDSIVVPHPQLERSVDHQFAAIALFEALNIWGKDCEILLYTNHGIGNEAFPLGPRDGMTGLPAWRGGNLHLTGIYSHPLSEEDQRRKFIALEAMHDLRPFDLRDGKDVAEIPVTEDYFRRGPRPNEIFFVTDVRGAQMIRNEFIDELRR